MLSLNLAAAAALALAAVQPTPTPTPTPAVPSITLPTPTLPTPAPPTTDAPGDDVSIVQVCALTSVEEINELLAGLTENDLVGALSPLLDVTTGDDESVEIDASLQLDDVRSELNCAPVDDDTQDPEPPLYADCAAAVAAGVAPLAEDEAGYRPGLDSDGDGVACEVGEVGEDRDGQVTVVPRGAAETGGRPPAGR